jgi:hypothetical protein
LGVNASLNCRDLRKLTTKGCNLFSLLQEFHFCPEELVALGKIIAGLAHQIRNAPFLSDSLFVAP